MFIRVFCSCFYLNTVFISCAVLERLCGQFHSLYQLCCCGLAVLWFNSVQYCAVVCEYTSEFVFDQIRTSHLSML